MTAFPATLPAAPAGCRVIPPFREGHLHFFQDGKPLTPDSALKSLRGYTRQGIFALQDMGCREGTGLRVKEVLSRNPDSSLVLTTGGYALYKKGCYGNFLGRGVRGTKEIREAVAGLVREGADFLKVVHSGIVSLKHPGRITSGGFTREELRCLVEEAQRHGLPVHCHVNSDRAIREAAAFPIASIQHGFFISTETLCLMKENGIAWTPTVYALDHWQHRLPPDQQGAVEKIIDGHLESLSRAAAWGVRLVVGTDSGSPGVLPGRSFLEELALWQRAGLNQEQILAAACLEPGEISKGNYVLVREDFIRERQVEAVISDGKPWAPDEV